MSQLYLINFEYMQTAFKGIYVMMDRRTEATYVAMWNLVLELVPELRTNVKKILIDCERAAANAALLIFPNISIELCLFHIKYVSTFLKNASYEYRSIDLKIFLHES